MIFSIGGLPASAAEMTDDEFIASLGDTNARGSVDRRRLAKILFGVAATLDGGKSSVQLLGAAVSVPDSQRQAINSLLPSALTSPAFRNRHCLSGSVAIDVPTASVPVKRYSLIST